MIKIMLIYILYFIFVFQLHLFNSQCLTNQFQSNGLCQNCHVTCLSCQGISENDCLSCSQTRLLSVNTNGNSCQCQSGYIQLIPTNESCKALVCNSKCQKCQNTAENCISCKYNRIISSNCGCPSRYFDNGNSLICQKCHYSCQTCKEAQKCLTCSWQNNRIYHLQTGKCACETGFADNLVQKCIQNSASSPKDLTIIIGVCIPIGIIVITVVILLIYKKAKKLNTQKYQSNIETRDIPNGSAKSIQNDFNVQSEYT